MEEDILKCDLSGLVKNHGFKELVVVGNLPYYISSPIVFHLIKYRRIIKKAVIMLQKEVAQRLVAKVNSKDYGILSCLLDYYASRQIIKVVKNSCFMPVPKVDSAIVELSFYKNSPIKVNDEVNFVKVVKTAFSQRRKTILNTLNSPSYNKQQLSLFLDSIGIKPSRRPQELTAEEFAKIANKLI
jgi:16S rRNA (adenine1518-N6/adenine1519-N6)-dimethyltransferase